MTNQPPTSTSAKTSTAVASSLRAYWARVTPYLHECRARMVPHLRTARKSLAESVSPISAPDWDDITVHPASDSGERQIFSIPPLDVESTWWLHAHQTPVPDGTPENTALVFATQDVQEWMAATLRDLGWDADAPVMITEGWVPARGERMETGQPVTTFTTASKAFNHARRHDPATSKAAGAAASASQHITVTSHLGRLLFAYHDQHQTHPGVGLTAAEAVNAAGLLTDGATGSPWRRVTDLRDMDLLTHLLDETGARVTRKNDSKTDGGVLVPTPLGLRAATALTVLSMHGYDDYPLNFDGPSEPTLFEELPATLARITTMAETDAQASVLTEHLVGE